MDFEKAYKKFLDGTATEEEVEFVRGEMKKASDINDILDNVKKEGATNVAEEQAVKEASKKYRRKDTKKIVIIACAVVLAVAIAIGCAIGIPVLVNAKENTKFSKAQAQEKAIAYVVDKYPAGAGKVKVRKVEKDLEVNGRIKNAHYVYVFEIYNGVNGVVEIEIDGRTGAVIDWDIDD